MHESTMAAVRSRRLPALAVPVLATGLAVVGVRTSGSGLTDAIRADTFQIYLVSLN